MVAAVPLWTWRVCVRPDQDFFFDPYMNSGGQVRAENTRVLPANERVQGRWNGDPYVHGSQCRVAHEAGDCLRACPITLFTFMTAR